METITVSSSSSFVYLQRKDNGNETATKVFIPIFKGGNPYSYEKNPVEGDYSSSGMTGRGVI